MNYEFKHIEVAIFDIFKRFGFKDFQMCLYHHTDSSRIGIRIEKNFSMLLVNSPEKFLQDLFKGFDNTPRYQELIHENTKLKQLLDKDPCNNLNLNWD